MSVQCANGNYLRFTALHQLNEVSKKDVSVPLAETFCIIGHLEERYGKNNFKAIAVISGADVQRFDTFEDKKYSIQFYGKRK